MSDIKVLKFGTSSMGKIGSNVIGFTPPPIPTDLADLIFWYDNDPLNMTLSGADAVSQWDDISGNSRHLTQGTGSLQPTYTTGLLGSNAGVNFDGAVSLKYMDAPLGSDFTTALDFFLVGTMQTVPNRAPYWFDGATINKRVGASWFNNFIRLNTNNTASTSVNIKSQTIPISAKCFNFIYNGATSQFYENNVKIGSDFDMKLNLIDTLRLGAPQSLDVRDRLDGYIFEFFAFSRVLSSTERGFMSSYLINKYGL